MPIMESTGRRLVLKSGSTTLTLSRDDDKAVMQQKLLFWNRKPFETALSNISEIKVDAAVDRASGVEIYSTKLVTITGAAWALPAADKKDALSAADALRTFLAAA